jgi:hypothetical protein
VIADDAKPAGGLQAAFAVFFFFEQQNSKAANKQRMHNFVFIC